MDRGLFDSFRRLQAQAGAQLSNVIDLPKVKAASVQTVLAAVVAVGAIAASPQAKAQEYNSFGSEQPAAAQQAATPDWKSVKSALGAGVGGVAGNIFGALSGVNRAAATVVGGVVGGAVGALEAGKDKMAQAAALQREVAAQVQNGGVQGGYPKLAADRDQIVAKMQLDAVSARMNYVDALKVAKEAEIDKSLMPNDKAAQQKYKQAVIVASKSLREEKEASKQFTDAFESLLGRYDVSAYSAAYAKLSQPVNINDSSYGKLAQYAAETLMVKGFDANDPDAAKAVPVSGGKRNDSISNGMF